MSKNISGLKIFFLFCSKGCAAPYGLKTFDFVALLEMQSISALRQLPKGETQPPIKNIIKELPQRVALKKLSFVLFSCGQKSLVFERSKDAAQ